MSRYLPWRRTYGPGFPIGGAAEPTTNGAEVAGKSGEEPTVQIGILTKGKPTLGMVMVSLLLQETRNITIHIVDTSDTPVVRRDDVIFAMRLAFDRGINCTYEYLRERERAFSVGRLKLLESFRGPHVCFMDDDVVFASSTLPRLLRTASLVAEYGYIAPTCRNAGLPGGALGGRKHYGPGGLFFQDETVRNVLVDYYSTTVDVLDRRKSRAKSWEVAFLTELFEALGRPCFVQDDNICYHLDYSERPNWDIADISLVRSSLAKARELVGKYAPQLNSAPVGPKHGS